MKKLILILSLVFFNIPIYAGYGSGDRIGMDNPAIEDLDMNGYDINDIENIDIDGIIDADIIELNNAIDDTVYYSFISSVGASPAAAAEVNTARFEYNWYAGDNQDFNANALEGVARSKGADESATLRGIYGRFYIDPAYSATLRTGIGGEFSARAGYSGAEISAEQWTAFTGARIWMAPYFTAISTANINNFHGLWIYNEHPTIPVTNGIYIDYVPGGGGFIYDITLQNDETITNSTDGNIDINATNVNLSENLNVFGYSTFASSVTISSHVIIRGNLDMNDYNIYVTSIIAKDNDGLYLLNNAGKGIYINGDANAGYLSVGNTVGSYFITLGSESFTTGKGIATASPRMIMDNVYDSAGNPSINKFCFYNTTNFSAGIGFSLYDFDLITGDNGNFRFHTGCTDIDGTGASEIFTILANGNVGVGAITPSTKFEVANGSITISGTNANLDVAGYSYFGSSVTISSHVVVLGDVTITGTVLSTATYSLNSDKLDGHDSTYFAIKTDVATATGTLTTSVTNLETSTATLEGYVFDLWTSTATLEGNLNTEIANRISEDNLISAATGQLKTSVTNLETSTATLEGYVFDLWTSTATLETAANLNTTHRGSDGSDHTFINQDVTTTGTPTFSTVTITTDLAVNGTFYYNASYAHGYARDVVVAVTGSTDTFVILDATWDSTVPSNGFTISGASCTYNGNGGTPKIFKVSGAFSAISGAANTVVYWAIFKNGVLYEAAIINRKIAVAADVGAMSLSTLVELSTGDILDVRLSGDNNTNITNKFVQFDIIQIN